MVCRIIQQIGKSFCSYLILENGEYIAQLSVITITKSNFPYLGREYMMQTFIQSLEFRIVNDQKHLYDATRTNAI